MGHVVEKKRPDDVLAAAEESATAEDGSEDGSEAEGEDASR